MVPAGHSTPSPSTIRDLPNGSSVALGRHAVGLTAMSAIAALAITLSISTTGELRFAVFAPSANAALETAAGLVAALAAFLVYGRFRITGLASDFALLIALSLLAATTLLFFTGPAVTGTTIGRLSVWARAGHRPRGTRVRRGGVLEAGRFTSEPPTAHTRGSRIRDGGALFARGAGRHPPSRRCSA